MIKNRELLEITKNKKNEIKIICGTEILANAEQETNYPMHGSINILPMIAQ